MRLTDAMRHRGPDGSGYLLQPLNNGTHVVGFGHRRLAIVDVSDAGAQPMWDASGSICIVFNGEIYNHIELRAELEAMGHQFRTSCDTEVLIEAYRAWGTDAFSKFRGMYAFALLDLTRQSVIFARDPFGKKPLFLAHVNGGVVFSSEIKPLLQYPGVSQRFDWGALGLYLQNRYVPSPDTFFTDVKKLPLGSWLEWKDEVCTETRFYTPPLKSAVADLTDFDEASQLFLKTFDDAVRLRLRSDAPFGAFLSGGIDSSAVVAAMAKHMMHPVPTFTVGFAEDAYSEGQFAADFGRLFHTSHEHLQVNADDFFGGWEEAILRRGAPVSEASDIPMMLLSKQAGKTVKMVLTGEGADEFFAGYPKYRAEHYCGLYHGLVPEFVHNHLIMPAISSAPYSWRRLKVLAKAMGNRNASERVRMWFGDMNEKEVQGWLGAHYEHRKPDEFPYRLADTSDLRRTLYFDQTSWLPDNSLERNDRMMMAGSVEGRMPFMDTELAALAARMPDSFLVNGLVGKRVLRKALHGILPTEILQRRKNGFRVPISLWFKSSHRHILEDLLKSPDSQTRRILNPELLSQLVDDHLSGRHNNERQLWTMCNLEMFLRQFKPEF